MARGGPPDRRTGGRLGRGFRPERCGDRIGDLLALIGIDGAAHIDAAKMSGSFGNGRYSRH
jgi:hypothetical protein